MQEIQEREAAEAFVGKRVSVGTPDYNRIVEFLYDEATLLDNLKLNEWGGLLATDIKYTAPLRQTLGTARQASTFIRSVQHYDDDYRSLLGRIMRLTGKSAWAEDPPSRTRRLVTNVLVTTTAKADEFAVVSYLLLTRSRFNFDEYDLVSAERHDVLRRDGESFKIARREILLDQAVLGTPNLAVFL